jgi:hypothetical protein
LAQPPEINETFLREVDENLRRDQLRDVAQKNATWIILAVILFLGASGGLIWYQQHKVQLAQQHIEQLADIYKDVGNGKIGAAPQQLADLSKSGAKAVRASAQFTRADVALQQDDAKLAATKFGEIANDGSLPKPYRDAALIRQTALQFDQLKPEEVIARLEPLAKPGSPWFGTASEMTALAMIKQGKKDEAGRLFIAIAKDKTVPDDLRQRAVQIAASLGLDVSAASAALGSQAQ